jgi:hypothetical protein
VASSRHRDQTSGAGDDAAVAQGAGPPFRSSLIPEASCRVVVEDARRAKKALDGAGLTYKETIAVEQELPNKPGALAECLDKLAAKGVNLNSICATVSKGGKKAVVVYSVAAEEKVAAV